MSEKNLGCNSIEEGATEMQLKIALSPRVSTTRCIDHVFRKVLNGEDKEGRWMSDKHKADIFLHLVEVQVWVEVFYDGVQDFKDMRRLRNVGPIDMLEKFPLEKLSAMNDRLFSYPQSLFVIESALKVELLMCLRKFTRKSKEEDRILLSSLGVTSANPEDIERDILTEELLLRLLPVLHGYGLVGYIIEKRVQTISHPHQVWLDVEIDAVAASFHSTRMDELVRKGILTPFHKLKGFERCLQQPEPSNRHNVPNEEDRTENLASASVARAVRSISEAAQARSTTKLLDAKALPKLEAPTRPFQRLKTPLKLPRLTEIRMRCGCVSLLFGLRGLMNKLFMNYADIKLVICFPEEDAMDNSVSSNYEDENHKDVKDADDNVISSITLEGGLKIPESIFSKLFDYQKVGVQWLWELHCQRAGGIIGDEMGLGKTIQIIAFLGSLHFSNMYKPSIVICPVTLLRQWRREVRKWYPSFCVEILHDSAQVPGNKKKQANSDESDNESEGSLGSDNDRTLLVKTTKKWDFLIDRILRSQSGLLITSYEQLRLQGEKLLDIEWGYAILDEGHRIRNPNAEITLVCKQLQTVHRIIMTGAPIQNKLTELWSLFDFLFPGKLGVLPIFEAKFAVPISVGGYANATPLQVSTAYRCAVVLRDLIMPYLLRRMKADVNAHLPKKTEHVLFCSLTAEQRSVYRAFLASSEVEQIFDGNKNSLYGIDVMRKICNHPDLLEREHSSRNPEYGNLECSGKMKVVAQLLKAWKEQGHRVLLFTLTQQMLDILEKFLITCSYTYRRMDGLTPIKQRMPLMDEFNNSNEVFIFILTTEVGGLGTNLTGANRVIIFDPDWNPSTDMQARERAWRIGQTQDVTVYRLITRGTIEEKVYHRQIYKHFLTNKILKNPQQRRFFKARDTKDLFTLNDDGEGGSTETSNIFSQLSGNVTVVGVHKDNQDKKKIPNAAAQYSDDAAVNRGTNSKTGPSRSKGKEKDDQTDGEVDQELNVLRSLFDAHGIHGSFITAVASEALRAPSLKEQLTISQVIWAVPKILQWSRSLSNLPDFSVEIWNPVSGLVNWPSIIYNRTAGFINLTLVFRKKIILTLGLLCLTTATSYHIRHMVACRSARFLQRMSGELDGDAINGLRVLVATTLRLDSLTPRVHPPILDRRVRDTYPQRGWLEGVTLLVDIFKSSLFTLHMSVADELWYNVARIRHRQLIMTYVIRVQYE
ncbi:hypothetical protein HHK36_012872 [Tetracentron sinense]|uniref:Uncharacterized protein n=1 Tax=Tetracentron sinense TaxID=13715 RepID=A0A834Z9W6_TETSI|nr:hypothetical protein HHK36_012872 [Tetracentron sinense]